METDICLLSNEADERFEMYNEERMFGKCDNRIIYLRQEEVIGTTGNLINQLLEMGGGTE